MGLEAQKTVEILTSGGVVAWPTDTTWGLLVAADHPNAIKRVYSIKRRPTNKPLQLLVGNLKAAEKLAVIDDFEATWKKLTSSFWPGGLTLVVPASKDVPGYLTHRGKVGLRLPADAELREVIDALGGYLAATSFNRSGEPPVASYEEALLMADGVDYVRPGKANGLASSVYELPEGNLLRAGALSADKIIDVLEEEWSRN